MNVSGSVCRLGGQRGQKVLEPKFQYENRTTMLQEYFESVPRRCQQNSKRSNCQNGQVLTSTYISELFSGKYGGRYLLK